MNLFSNLVKKLTTQNDLRIFIYNKDEDVELPYSVKLSCRFGDKIFNSWGVSESKDVAYLKALIELLERITINFSCPLYYSKGVLSEKKSISELSKEYRIQSSLLHPLNSNGCGAGLLSRMAKESAKKELIERHTILSAQLLRINPLQIYPNFVKKGDLNNIEFFYWICGSYYVVISVLKVKNGYYFAFGCNTSLNESVKKSFEEIIPALIFSRNEGEFLNTDHKIVKGDIGSFSRYWRLANDHRYYDFLKNRNSDEAIAVPEITDFYFSNIYIPPFLKIKFPFHCYRCISPKAQQLFFDNWSSDYINPYVSANEIIPLFPHSIA